VAEPGPNLVRIAIPHAVPLAAVLGATQTQALVVLFVLLPFVVAAVVIAFVSWRSSNDPPPVRTSVILATGDPATAEVLSVKAVGLLLDVRPMVRFLLRVDAGPDEASFELEVFQSLPRAAARAIQTGDVVEVRVTADRSAGAIVWLEPPAAERGEHRRRP
jgi:hypothetical protein